MKWLLRVVGVAVTVADEMRGSGPPELLSISRIFLKPSDDVPVPRPLSQEVYSYMHLSLPLITHDQKVNC